MSVITLTNRNTSVASSYRVPTLGRRSRRILRALAEVVLPTTEHSGGVQVDLDAMVDFVDSFYPHMSRVLRILFPIGLWVLQVGTRIWGGTLRGFTSLDVTRRARYVNGWVHSRMLLRRDLIKGVKGMVLLAYYSDPRVMQKIAYYPEPFVKLVSAERLVRFGHDL